MQRAEAIARERQVGVWADPANVPPWEWRRRRIRTVQIFALTPDTVGES